MNVRNCRKCRKIFNYFAGPVMCGACREEQEKIFQEVKKYVQDHRNADIPTVSRECGVERDQIRQWIKEERLCFSDDSPIGIPCERCGATIKSGRFCEPCKRDMTQTFSQAISRPQSQFKEPRKRDVANPKMRYLE